MKKLYRWLLFLYPADYRSIFGAEMAEVFDETYASACERSIWWLLTFCLRELTGLVRTALYARIRIYDSELWAVRMKVIANGRVIVPALIFMFTAVVAAVEILKSFVFHGLRLRPILLLELPMAILWLILACVGGVIGWGIAFLARRTGMQRLANRDTGSTEN